VFAGRQTRFSRLVAAATNEPNELRKNATNEPTAVQVNMTKEPIRPDEGRPRPQPATVFVSCAGAHVRADPRQLHFPTARAHC
jgi:hypothetical protein